MSSYGWSLGQMSPFGSSFSSIGEVPSVNDSDFSYITPQQFDELGYGSSAQLKSDYDPRDSDSVGRPAPSPTNAEHDGRIHDPDVLLLKYRGVTYPEHFPAYSIGDGKLLVADLRDTVQLLWDIPRSRANRIKLLYKGRELRDPRTPVRAYGVKDKSQIVVEMSEVNDGDGSDLSDEVLAQPTSPPGRKEPKHQSKNHTPEPRTSTSSLGVDRRSPDEPAHKAEESMTGSTSERQLPVSPSSPAAPSPSALSPSLAVPGSPMDQLNKIGTHFDTKLLPRCLAFTAHPLEDPKKRDDEYKWLSETLMSLIIRLDSVETTGLPDVRARRKQLIKQVQGVLNKVDGKKLDA